MKNVWSNFRSAPRDAVDAYVFDVAQASLAGQDNLLQLAKDRLPRLSDAEVSGLVNLNTDLVAPPDTATSFSAWLNAWEDGLYFCIRACEVAAREPLRVRVGTPGRNSARLMYFDCLIAAMVKDGGKAQDFEALASEIHDLGWLDMFETSDVKDWMQALVRHAASEAEAMIEALRIQWFANGLGGDAHDDDHTLFAWASAALYASIWAPDYRPAVLEVLRGVVGGNYFTVPIVPDDPEDAPTHGVARVQKIGCVQGAAVVLLDEEPTDAGLLEACRSFANSPAEDTRQIWAQWPPLASRTMPHAFSALRAAGLAD